MAYQITGDVTLLGKFILGLSALAFISYGVVSLFSPAIPAGVAGLIINSGDGFAEVGGMYGGLQTGVGLFCLLALIQKEFYRPGLAVLALTVGSLAAARLISAWVAVEPITFYTHAALGYELITAACAVCAFYRTPHDPA
jgi:hypothetical protein